MQDAYKVANLIWQENLSESDKQALADLKPEDILVTPGEYDQIQQVLGIFKIPHAVGIPDSKARKTAQIMLVNCPGNALDHHTNGVKKWVAAGGYLITTDWAVRPLQAMFPSHIRWTGDTTADTCVQLDVNEKSTDLLNYDQATDELPIWWLEGSSYPFRVSEDVDIMLTSKELKDRYGSSLVAVSWDYGEGKVVHIISHLYLQRADLRSDKSSSTLETLKAYKGVGYDKLLAMNLETPDMVSKGEVDASTSSSAFLLSSLLDASKYQKKPTPASPASKDSPPVTKWVD